MSDWVYSVMPDGTWIGTRECDERDTGIVNGQEITFQGPMSLVIWSEP